MLALHPLRDRLCNVNLSGYAVISGNKYLLNLSEKNYDFRREPSKNLEPSPSNQINSKINQKVLLIRMIQRKDACSSD